MDESGALFNSAGRWIVDPATSRAVQWRRGEQLVIRADGLLAVVGPGRRPIVVAPGTVLGQRSDAAHGLTVGADGSLVITNGAYQSVRVDPRQTAIVTGPSGSGLARPGTGQLIGADASVIFLGGNGAVMAFSDAETTMVDDSGEAAVFDRGARQLARSANASAKVAGVPSGSYTANTVGAALSTATVKTNSRITVTCRGKSGPEAIAGANAAVNAYVALRRQAANQEASALARRSDEAVRVLALELAETSPARAAINARQEQLQTRIADVLRERDKTLLDAARQGDSVSVSSPANRADLDRGSRRLRNVAAGLLVGVIAAVAAAYLLERRRPRLHSAEEAETLLGAPLLGSAVDVKAKDILSGLTVLDVPNSPASEAYRFASAVLVAGDYPLGPPRFGVLSGTTVAGMAHVSANLAVCLAQLHRPLLVLDAELETQGATSLPERHSGSTAPVFGLVNVLAEQCSLQNALTKATLGDATELWLMSGGSRADCLGQMFDRERLQAILATVRFEGAAVLACLPPLLDLSYATALLSELDAVVVVVVHHGSRKDLLKSAERLRLLRIPVAGFVYSRMTKHGIGRLDVHLSPAAPDSSARGNELDVRRRRQNAELTPGTPGDGVADDNGT